MKPFLSPYLTSLERLLAESAKHFSICQAKTANERRIQSNQGAIKWFEETGLLGACTQLALSEPVESLPQGTMAHLWHREGVSVVLAPAYGKEEGHDALFVARQIPKDLLSIVFYWGRREDNAFVPEWGINMGSGPWSDVVKKYANRMRARASMPRPCRGWAAPAVTG